jgi:hypothetical protein
MNPAISRNDSSGIQIKTKQSGDAPVASSFE